MQPPDFWNHRSGRSAAPVIRALLWPASWVYARATRKRIENAQPFDPGIPVICVGNASLGGTGKTPITAYLLESMTRMGIPAAALSRGYGGREKGPIIVSQGHTAEDVGDEPLLLARHGRVWIAAGRGDGARAARSKGARMIIMDDGHQNPSLKKTLSFLVVDAELGFGNGCVFPAGPLREPVSAALGRADAVILMMPHAGYQPDEELLTTLKPLPVIPAWLTPTENPPAGKLFAFAGIGRPNKFFDALKRAGADLVEGIPYRDHFKYTDGDMMSLLDMAREYEASLITTEKDFVRIPSSFRQHVTPWPVTAEFGDELTLRRLLHPVIAAAKL